MIIYKYRSECSSLKNKDMISIDPSTNFKSWIWVITLIARVIAIVTRTVFGPKLHQWYPMFHPGSLTLAVAIL